MNIRKSTAIHTAMTFHHYQRNKNTSAGLLQISISVKSCGIYLENISGSYRDRILVEIWIRIEISIMAFLDVLFGIVHDIGLTKCTDYNFN